MVIELNDQQVEDLKQLIYRKVKEIDNNPNATEGSRDKNFANRLDVIYIKLNEPQ